MFAWIRRLFKPKPFEPVVFEKKHCKRHEQFKKGCAECRSLNVSN